jgi:hypothetical protein
MNSNTDTQTSVKPIRAAVFRGVNAAHQAVAQLLRAGFTREQISVLCSEDSKERHFREFEHEDPAGSHAIKTIEKGGAAGAIMAGLASAGLATAAGVSLLAAGPGLLVAGAVAGSFIAAMQSRGEEGALADFYDQALTRGDLLVAVEDHNPGGEQRLAAAEQLFRQAGAESIELDSED